MSISKQDVELIAKLSNLNFGEKEEEKIIKDLEQILKYMEKLNELDTDNVEETVNPYYMENNFRDDEIETSLHIENVIENAPNSKNEYILVPRVIN
ncbi:Asp-tRNA(Asn)/Glu-tRNA(Gln) amidotransferase subunit GatC [Clostridium sp.]|jgi:aspartyl-tRNA(Asn)/glutamyl-tRNA(Gln) amidotransferase subunit C|uniref:Asp-tRNA(Asn)/Glu-tRNA(Gln) amidotransferase subunit GatC n=1 Tax=Clostridium sp. TaxID=1506 RepID=UPI0039F5A6E0